jgi:hypothetical protein
MSDLTAREAAIARAVRAACAARARRVERETSLAHDRLTDYTRGVIGASREIARGIEGLDLEAVVREVQ